MYIMVLYVKISLFMDNKSSKSECNMESLSGYLPLDYDPYSVLIYYVLWTCLFHMQPNYLGGRLLDYQQKDVGSKFD